MKTALLIISFSVIFSSCSKSNGSCDNRPCCTTSNRHYKCDNTTNDCDQSADWEITSRVKTVLMTDTAVSASARFVSVETTNGVVTLTGNVPSREESRQIERRVKGITGVRKVDNQLTFNS